VLASAERELKEKTNLEAKLKHVGDVYVLVSEGGEVVSHSLCHTFYTENFSGILEGNGQYGEFFWDDIDNFKKEDLFPGTTEILKLVTGGAGEFIFNEVHVNG
jgi:ADP-ribose pyrophosphatase YjhB (NUDIX family)